MLFTHPALAGKHLAFIGGGGEPVGPSTIFDHNIEHVASYANSSASDVRVSFNGGHKFTETKLKEKFPANKLASISPSNYEALIAQYESQLQSGAIKAGDQLLVIIDSHGALRVGNQISHSIAAGPGQPPDLTTLSGNALVSMDRLKQLSELAEHKGVKLGILDFSCHSGASLVLANSKTCVVTSTGPESFGYGSETSFSGLFTRGMLPGKNLEEVFLDSRSKANEQDFGFPMISSPEGTDAQNQIYPVLRRYMDHTVGYRDKFDADILSSMKNQTCEQENLDLETFLKLTKQMESATNGLNLEALRTSLTEYQNLRAEILQGMKAQNEKLSEKIELCSPSGCHSYPVSEVLAIPVPQRITQYEILRDSANTPAKRAEAQSWVSYFHKTVRGAQEQILKTTPSLGKTKNFLTDYPNLSVKTFELAKKVAKESRKAYSALYRKSPQANACRDFVL